MEISLKQLINLIRKNILPIIVCAAIGLFGAFGISKFVIPKTYVSTVKLYVSTPQTNQSSALDINSLNYAQKIVDTYIEMLQTNNFYQKIIDKANLNYTVEKVKSMVKFSTLKDTEVFQAQVSSNSPDEAKAVADQIATLAPDTISQLKDSASLKVVDSATLPDKASSPNVMLNSVIGFLLGMIFSVVIVLIRDILDVRVKNEDDIMEKYNIPILASIPAFNIRFSKGNHSKANQ